MMSTTLEQLLALEKHAGVIDPKPENPPDHYLWYEYDAVCRILREWWWEGHSWIGSRSYSVPIALAIRIQQAMDWLTAWCDESGNDWHMAYYAVSQGGGAFWAISVTVDWPNTYEIEPEGMSLAEALAKTIEQLKEHKQ